VSPLVNWSIAGTLSALLLFAGLDGFAHHPVAAAEAAKSSACLAPQYREFDFWIGDWNAFDVSDPNTIVARTKVEKILDGCVLFENYEGATGLNGRSFTTYDESRKAWRQSWVTNRGQFLQLDGNGNADEMVLTGADQTTNGNERQVRGTWKSVGRSVRETAVTSTDGGKTWKPWFDLLFRPRAEASNSDDVKAVADLDKQYQAAVRRNDAATMQRILADDFILVTGSGTTYTKTDLLEEARSGRMRYSHQEDTEQTVRIWGDTAVVTAKLWEKGMHKGTPFDYRLWFSDTYVRTPTGWRYVFGQASLPRYDRGR
jgi:ketosteroid isomerase-like protein